jgi:hypothetical protein
VLVLAQLTHAITFAAHHLACIAEVNRFFPGRLRGRGQALYTTLGYGVPGVLGGLGGGWLSLPEAAHRLQALGVTIAVDAFGAGPASLSHLDRLPVRTVCLAPSFIARAGPSTPQRWVVESTARLAQSMGMSTLAEGVAQETQVLALAAMGCDLGVGDVCGPWLDAEGWTQRWRAAPAARAA